MTENVENIILEHLRVIRADVASVRADVSELKTRVTGLEISAGMILQHTGHLASTLAGQQVSHDKLVARVERLS